LDVPKSKSAVTEFYASSLVHAFELALKWTTTVNDGGRFWFRGINNMLFELEPGAYWREDYDELPPLLDFVQEGRAYADIGELDDWKTYYFAQHSGIPTRLLDWTESFSAALFFALDGWDGKTTPCVWIIRPECVNKLSVKWDGIITPEQNKELELWLPQPIKTGAKKITTKDGKWIYDSSKPLAIYPRKGNNRIIAQQGTFTVHGTEHLKLNEWIVKRTSKHSELICRVILKDLPKEESLRSLQMLGIRRHTMYPDLANFILYLRDAHGW
jgi:hypothetical protein